MRLVRSHLLHQVPQRLVIRVAGRGERARRDDEVYPRRDSGRARRRRVRLREYLLHVQRIAHRVNGLDRDDLTGEHGVGLGVPEVQADRIGYRDASPPRTALQRHRGRGFVRADATEGTEVRLTHASHVLDETRVARRATPARIRPPFDQPVAQTPADERENVPLLRQDVVHVSGVGGYVRFVRLGDLDVVIPRPLPRRNAPPAAGEQHLPSARRPVLPTRRCAFGYNTISAIFARSVRRLTRDISEIFAQSREQKYLLQLHKYAYGYLIELCCLRILGKASRWKRVILGFRRFTAGLNIYIDLYRRIFRRSRLL